MPSAGECLVIALVVVFFSSAIGYAVWDELANHSQQSPPDEFAKWEGGDDE